MTVNCCKGTVQMLRVGSPEKCCFQLLNKNFRQVIYTYICLTSQMLQPRSTKKLDTTEQHKNMPILKYRVFSSVPACDS